MSRNGRVYSFPPFFWLPFLCTYVGVHMSRNMCKSQRTAFQETILSFFPICFEMESHTSTTPMLHSQATWSSSFRRFSCVHLRSCHRNAVIIYTCDYIPLFLCGTRDQAGCQAYAETSIFPY